MAEYLIKDTTLRGLADEIRRETGKTDPLFGASMTDELRTFSDSLAEEIALQNTALDDLEAELNNLEEGRGGSASNKLALVVGTQSADNPYDITASDLEGVTEIRQYGFYRGSMLRNIETPTTCTSIGNNAFQNCSALTTASMPSVESIGNNAFGYCPSLTSVDMPNVTSIGNTAFISCSALTSIDIPNVTSIGEGVFLWCSTLTSLTIPSTCTSIGNSGLQCGSSTNKCTFIFEGTTPPTIYANTFSTSQLNKIIVPAGYGEAYKTATNWTTVADYIEEATE